jgi:hypothetical protein
MWIYLECSEDSISLVDTEGSQSLSKNGSNQSPIAKSTVYWEETEFPLLGVDDGPPYRAHRIRACGNGVVSQQVKVQ